MLNWKFKPFLPRTLNTEAREMLVHFFFPPTETPEERVDYDVVRLAFL